MIDLPRQWVHDKPIGVQNSEHWEADGEGRLHLVLASAVIVAL